MFQLRSARPLKTPVTNAIKQYSAVAQPLTDAIDVGEAGKGLITDGELKVSALANGVRVASIDTGGSISRLSLCVYSGSRNETSSNLGITHVAKNAAFNSSGGRSALRVTREMQAVGGGFDAAHNREFLSRNSVFLRSKLHDVLENITGSMTAPENMPWHFAAVAAQTRLDNGALASDGIAENLEEAHKVAFRTGLGNSLFCSDLNVGGFSSTDLDEFAAETYVGKKTTIVGLDCDHDELLRCVQETMSGLEDGVTTHSAPAAYFGGNSHIQTSNGLAHLSVTAAGPGLFSADLAAFSVLQHILGAGSYMKWGSNTVSSRLNAASQAVATEGAPLAVNCVNANYSDSGLFGVYAIAIPADIANVAKAAVGQIQAVASGGISVEELQRAKNQATGSLVMGTESKANVLDDVAKQMMFTGAVSTVGQAVSNIANVTVADVQRVAASLTASPTLVATGNTSESPYLEDLL